MTIRPPLSVKIAAVVLALAWLGFLAAGVFLFIFYRTAFMISCVVPALLATFWAVLRIEHYQTHGE